MADAKPLQPGPKTLFYFAAVDTTEFSPQGCIPENGVVQQQWLLKDMGNAPADRQRVDWAGLDPLEKHLAGVRHVQESHHSQQRGLAGAVGAEQREKFSLLDFESWDIEDGLGAVANKDIAQR
jgi:hypothetical protein